MSVWLFALSDEVKYILMTQNHFFLYNACGRDACGCVRPKNGFVVILLMLCRVKSDYTATLRGRVLISKVEKFLKCKSFRFF